MLQSETDGDDPGDCLMLPQSGSPPLVDAGPSSPGHNLTCNDRGSPQTKPEPDYAARLLETKCLEPEHSADWPDRSYIKLSQSPVDHSTDSCYQHELTSVDAGTMPAHVSKYQNHSEHSIHHATPRPYLPNGFVAEQRNCHSSGSKPSGCYENKLTSLQRSASLSPSLPSAISHSEFQTEFKFRPKLHRFKPYTDPPAHLASHTEHRAESPPYYSSYDQPEAHHNFPSFKCGQSFQDEPEDLSVRTCHPTAPTGHPTAFPKNLNFSSHGESSDAKSRFITTQSGSHVVPYCFFAAKSVDNCTTKSVDNCTVKSIDNCTAKSVGNCKGSVEENFPTSLKDQTMTTV